MDPQFQYVEGGGLMFRYTIKSSHREKEYDLSSSNPGRGETLLYIVKACSGG